MNIMNIMNIIYSSAPVKKHESGSTQNKKTQVILPHIRKPLINIAELSPKTIRRNVSHDNFMKFQWSWTL